MNDLQKIINRYTRKVDSLNWQNITYQKIANDLLVSQLQSLMHKLVDTDHDEAHKKIEGFGPSQVHQDNSTKEVKK